MNKMVIRLVTAIVAVCGMMWCTFMGLSSAEHRQFEKSFGISYPSTTADREAMKPFIAKRLKEMRSRLTVCETRGDLWRDEFDALPANTPNEVAYRVKVYRQHEEMMEVQKELSGSFDTACNLAARVGFRDLAISCGARLDINGRLPFN